MPYRFIIGVRVLKNDALDNLTSGFVNPQANWSDMRPLCRLLGSSSEAI